MFIKLSWGRFGSYSAGLYFSRLLYHLPTLWRRAHLDYLWPRSIFGACSVLPAWAYWTPHQPILRSGALLRSYR